MFSVISALVFCHSLVNGFTIITFIIISTLVWYQYWRSHYNEYPSEILITIICFTKTMIVDTLRSAMSRIETAILVATDIQSFTNTIRPTYDWFLHTDVILELTNEIVMCCLPCVYGIKWSVVLHNLVVML